jgi:hypothetical protein
VCVYECGVCACVWGGVVRASCVNVQAWVGETRVCVHVCMHANTLIPTQPTHPRERMCMCVHACVHVFVRVGEKGVCMCV